MKYKNVSKKDLAIPGIGLVKSGQTKEMPKGFHNANFERVKKVEPGKVIESPKKNNQDKK